MEEIEKIINNAKGKMREMLKSVYRYNSGFIRKQEENKLLEKIIFSMSIVDRRFFVEDEEYAYDDNALAIGEGQTISQPSTVTRMLMLAELEEGDKVLEVGAGSGWNACLISFLVYPGNVLSIDRINALVEKAKRNFLALKNYLKIKMPHELARFKVNFKADDAFNLKGKYDKIIITAGIPSKEVEEKIKEMAFKLLKQEGILICPYTAGPMIIFKKKGRLIREETKEEYVLFL